MIKKIIIETSEGIEEVINEEKEITNKEEGLTQEEIIELACVTNYWIDYLPTYCETEKESKEVFDKIQLLNCKLWDIAKSLGELPKFE